MKKYIFIIFLLMFLLSCEYKLTETNHIDINPPDNNLQIDLTNIADSITVSGITDFEYNLEYDEAETFYCDMFIDDNYITSLNSETGFFSIDTNEYSLGAHTLTLRIRENFGMGSVLETLGDYLYELERSWLLYVDNSPITSSIIINNTEIVDGKLRLYWNEFTGIGFEKYEMVLNNQSYSILDQTQNYFDDTEFVTGSEYYQVNLHARSSMISSDPFYYLDNQPHNGSCTITEQNHPNLTWDQCDYSICSGYIIYRNDNGWELIETINDNFVTEWIDTETEVIFGDKVRYTVVAIKPGEDNSYPDYDNSFFAHKGTEFVRYYDEFCYNISDNLVYTTNNAAQLGYALINYDFDIMDSLNCNYISSNSPDIKWIESTNELFELYGNSIKEYNPLSLELVNMISLSNFFEYPFNTSKRFIGATMIAVGGSYDDGHCYFLIDRSNNSYYQCEMLNMQDMTSNGSFIADSEWIYEVQDFQLFQRFNIEDKIKVFFKDNDYAVLIDEQNVEIVNLEEITIVNSFTIIQDTNYYNAYGSDLISCYDHYNDLYYEINIFNGAIDYNISASTFCYKTGNKIFSSSGLYMELEE